MQTDQKEQVHVVSAALAVQRLLRLRPLSAFSIGTAPLVLPPWRGAGQDRSDLERGASRQRWPHSTLRGRVGTGAAGHSAPAAADPARPGRDHGKRGAH